MSSACGGDGLGSLGRVAHGRIVVWLVQSLWAVSSGLGEQFPLHGRGRRFEPGTAHVDLGIACRVALVMGASQGIGLGIAVALAREGARIGMASRSQERLDHAAGSIDGDGDLRSGHR